MTPDARAVALGHVFRQPQLLHQALTHRSFAAEHNERLEFIGDGVLNCAIALMLYERFPQMAEGDLSRMRAGLVNRDTLHRHAACRSQRLLHQGDKAKTAHFTTQEFVPICADAHACASRR